MSIKLDALEKRNIVEVCEICLRPLAPRRSPNPHICLNCSRIVYLSSLLDKMMVNFGKHKLKHAHIYEEVTQSEFQKLTRIRAIGQQRTANCPLCGARCEVKGVLHPVVKCDICHVMLSQSNGRILAYDTLLNRPIPYDTDEWFPVFDRYRETIQEENKSTLLDILEVLDKWNL